MGIEIRLPDLGEAAKFARINIWLKAEGEAVSAGEPIVEVETDKTSIEIPSPCSGVLQAIWVRAGDDIPPDTVLAVIVETDSADATVSEPTSVSKPPRDRTLPRIVEPGLSLPAELPPQPRLEDESLKRNDVTIAASPLALRMAAIAEVPLTEIPSTGPDGRVRKIDVDAVLRQRHNVAALDVSNAATSAQSYSASADDEQPLSTMRRVTADRLLHAKQTIPHFYLRVDCAVDRLVQIRSELNRHGEDSRLSVTVFAVRAAALALRKVPRANSSWAESAVRIHKTIDIAVAVNTTAGLMTPIVREADGKPLATISRELKTLAAKARQGRLEPQEYIGGTFTISNLGMYGVSSLYPIINPPQSCILGIGAIVQRPIVRNGELAVGSVLSATLAADHRVIDGAAGAELLAEVRRLIEDPWLMLF